MQVKPAHHITEKLLSLEMKFRAIALYLLFPLLIMKQIHIQQEAPAELYTDDILESAKDTTAIVVLSRDSSEASDYSTNMKDPNGDSFDTPMSISAYEKEMIQLAKENSNGKVIVLINSDVPMEIQELKDDPEIGAILWTGLPGMNGFLGVCDVLSGDVNPSGHISDTYAKVLFLLRQ